MKLSWFLTTNLLYTARISEHDQRHFELGSGPLLFSHYPAFPPRKATGRRGGLTLRPTWNSLLLLVLCRWCWRRRSCEECRAGTTAAKLGR